MNPSTTKKPKKSKEIPMPKTQTSNQSDINKNKAQELNLNPLTTEVKQKPKISRKNLNLENPNQLNLNTKTEIKEKKRNSQAMLNKLNEEMNIHEKAKPNEKKLKKNNTKGKHISDQNEVSGLEALKDKDSLDSKDLPLNQVIKSQNIDIKGKLKAINTFNLGEEIINTKTNSPHNNKRQLTGKIKQIKKEQKKENINQSKTVMTTDAQNNDSLDDLWSDNEIDENKTNSNNKIKKTKFLTVSTNPFMTKKVPKKSLRVESSKTISDLKQKLNMDNNINNNNANKIPDIKEQQKHTHHVKSTTLNLRNSIAQTSIPNTIRMNNDINNLGSINQNPKKTLNYKDENGYSALHYACEEGNLKIVEILIDTHCNPNILNNLKQTPLHLSAKGGYFDISKKLIESGAILNIYDSEKNSPIHYICKNNYVELLKFCLTKSPQIEEKNIYGKTPKDLTTNPEIKNLIDDYISKLDKESKTSKISSNEASDLVSRTKSQKAEIKNLRNILSTNRNRTNTVNIKNTNNQSDLSGNKEKKDFDMKSKKKKYSHQNNLISASTNLKIELNSNNALNNSSNTSNNKSPSPDSTNKEKMSSKNCILKKEIRSKKKSHDNSLTNINKEKDNSNIYFTNTNNINNNNININIYSIEGIKRNRANANYVGSHSISKTREYIAIDEPNLNNSKNMNINNSTINKSSTTIKSKILTKKNANPIHVSQTKNEKKSKFYQNNVKKILDSIDSCDKNIFNLNKTEENIITTQKKINIKNPKEKNENAILNNSANIHYLRNNNNNNKNNKNNRLLTNPSKFSKKINSYQI